MANIKEYVRNRPDSKIGKIAIDHDLCIGCSTCIAVSDKTYEFDAESKSVVIDPNAADDETLIMSAESCPTKAILLFDKEGKQIFPN